MSLPGLTEQAANNLAVVFDLLSLKSVEQLLQSEVYDSREQGDSESKPDEEDKQAERSDYDASWGHLVAIMWPSWGLQGKLEACIGVQVYRYINILVYPYNFAPIYRCT